MNTKKIAGLGLLTAIVVVLQALAVVIRPAGGIFSISLVLIPIVIGASLYGWKAGAWLGFVFGVVVLINDSTLFYAINIPGTIATVLVKGTACGLIAGLVFKVLEHKNIWLATICAAIVCPIVNTGIFLIGCVLFFMEAINGWAAAAGFENAGAYLIVGFVGINFLIEMGINIVLSSIIVRVLKLEKR